MKFTNYLIANFITQLNFGIIRRLRYIKININNRILEILRILYTHGAIRTFLIKNGKIWIYFKYTASKPSAKFTIISKPGNRIYWSLNELSCKYNNNNFSGFYIISTQQGIRTTHYCLIPGRISGEILIKVEI